MGAGEAEEVVVAVSSCGEMEVEGAEDPGGGGQCGLVGGRRCLPQVWYLSRGECWRRRKRWWLSLLISGPPGEMAMGCSAQSL